MTRPARRRPANGLTHHRTAPQKVNNRYLFEM
jgi:hypothetical protein